MNRAHIKRWLIVSCLGLAFACSSETKSHSSTPTDAGNEETTDAGDTPATPAPSIAGNYVDEYGYSTIIVADTWTLAKIDGSLLGVYHLTLVDNDDSFAVAQNDEGNTYFPGLWSRFDWTVDGADALWYCQTVFDAATAEEAEQAPPADAQNLKTGCAGCAWTQLVPQP